MDRSIIGVYNGRTTEELTTVVGVMLEELSLLSNCSSRIKLDDADVEIVELFTQTICEPRHQKTGRRDVNDGLQTVLFSITYLFPPSSKKLASIDGGEDRPSIEDQISEMITRRSRPRSTQDCWEVVDDSEQDGEGSRVRVGVVP